MRTAVASGKGGTGKTLVATNLAYMAAREGLRTAYLDCDVEEPNGHIFLRPEISRSTTVTSPVPEVDPESCTHCGRCGEICRFSAILSLGEGLLTFPELCHSCGGCRLVCPAGAISEKEREIGRLETGKSGEMKVVQGVLNIGEVKTPEMIRAVRGAGPESGTVFIDSPPGTSCPVVEAVKGVDYLVLVTEPTPFGMNDLELAMGMAEVLELPFGVVLNRADLRGEGEHPILDRGDLTLLAEIPFDRRVAEVYSRGELVSVAIPGYAGIFGDLLNRIMQEAGA
jgi:MinD superfamily P-loop ATPase